MQLKQRKTLAERLNRFVTPEPNSGCWLWAGAHRNGYGVFGRWEDGTHKVYYAHRVSYQVHVGDIPDGYFVCHSCDVKSCSNPDHLFVGTQADNMADMSAKELNKWKPGDGHTRICGEGNNNSKLTTEAVAEIRESAERGVDLARRYGVSPSLISLIRKGKAWKREGVSSAS